MTALKLRTFFVIYTYLYIYIYIHVLLHTTYLKISLCILPLYTGTQVSGWAAKLSGGRGLQEMHKES